DYYCVVWHNNGWLF
nr:immunoglobulin light chain junction region [Macaca mulatta]